MSRAGETDQETESRVADLMEEVLSVNRMLHEARGWREREPLSSQKAGLLSSAIILLHPAALRLHRQSMPGRSDPYLLVTLIAFGRSRSFHIPMEHLTCRARAVVEERL